MKLKNHKSDLGPTIIRATFYRQSPRQLPETLNARNVRTVSEKSVYKIYLCKNCTNFSFPASFQILACHDSFFRWLWQLQKTGKSTKVSEMFSEKHRQQIAHQNDTYNCTKDLKRTAAACTGKLMNYLAIAYNVSIKITHNYRVF